ncbi:MFS transporter [Corynebacterium cystitidis]|uniref:MFS transporter n=1 Tax=Corynebacterium cystitidis TaxID=35757 RepID=UPI00211EE2C3|nr:MFS transporter [Corynebacterium cystitidis]
MDRLRYACIMIGGFLGPFAGQSLSVVLPEFAADFGITLSLASLTMTAYMLPFAVMMLFSTHLARGVSPSVVVRVAYAIIAVACVVLVFTPVWWPFVLAYLVAGLCNAFTAPFLQLILHDITPDERLGQALGTYAAMQSFGLFSAPLLAGVTALVSWRLMFVVLGAFAVVIVIVRVPFVRADDSPAPTGQRHIGWPHLRGMLTLFAVGMAVIGISFIVALYVGERFGADAVTRGAIVMAGGLTAFVFSRFVGGLADRIGARPVLVAGLLAAAVALIALVMTPSLVLLAVLWGLAVLAAQAVQVGVNMLVLRAPGGSRMLSTVQAFRFFGNAATPLLVLPLFNVAPWYGFGVAAAVLVIMAGVNLMGARE